MILLQAELAADLHTPAGLCGALQQAIELEHATIPTYLYALYSLKPGANVEAASIVRSVVLEEMTHMALSCNILNALDGSPKIDDPCFVPRYPGKLPGSVESGLTVPLGRFSLALIHDVFMSIEEPENAHDYPGPLQAGTGLTIGQFYRKIQDAIRPLDHTAFKGDAGRQVTHELGPHTIIEVTDAESACAAIDLIVEQGEGTTTSPLDQDGDLAHYYRFEEIVKGRRLLPDSTVPAGYSYTGEPIPFDTDGVYPVVQNPEPYPAGSAARYADEVFNYTYTCLLRSLHDTFNGYPDTLLKAVGLMESCKQMAMDLMTIEVGDGAVAGPSFRYQPTNP